MKTHTYIHSLYKAVSGYCWRGYLSVLAVLLLTVLCNACLDDDWGTGCAPTTGDIRITLIGSYPGTNITTDPDDETRRSFSVDVIEGTFDSMVLPTPKQSLTRPTGHLRLECTTLLKNKGLKRKRPKYEKV